MAFYAAKKVIFSNTIVPNLRDGIKKVEEPSTRIISNTKTKIKTFP